MSDEGAIKNLFYKVFVFALNFFLHLIDRQIKRNIEVFGQLYKEKDSECFHGFL
jgi:hypothetical protein